MKFKHISTETLNNSAEVVSGTQIKVQANITFEILPEIQGHTIPDKYKIPVLTFWGLEFNSPNDLLNSSLVQEKGLAKLKEVYGDANVE